jgi:hypothetical protein
MPHGRGRPLVGNYRVCVLKINTRQSCRSKRWRALMRLVVIGSTIAVVAFVFATPPAEAAKTCSQRYAICLAHHPGDLCNKWLKECKQTGFFNGWDSVKRLRNSFLPISNVVAVRESAAGTSRHLVRCSDMSEVGGRPEVTGRLSKRRF